MRQVAKSTTRMANKICPPLELDDYDDEEKELVVGYQNFFVMCWTAVHVVAFLLFLSFFLRSGETNVFMRRLDCCEAEEIKFTAEGLPWPDCSQKSCVLYDFTWDGEWTFFDDKPREPEKGKKSKLFTVEEEDSQYCCLLSSDVEDDECCDFLPWNKSCGVLMWGSCLASVLAFLMTQVILIGIYSIFARRNQYYTILAILAGIFLRVGIFFFNFHLFFAFLFIFCFYWLGMMWCDNPHAYNWYKFGLWFFWYFFDNMAWVFKEGASTYSGGWSLGAMVGATTIVATLIDLVFWVLTLILRKVIRNANDKPLFDFAFFEL